MNKSITLKPKALFPDLNKALLGEEADFVREEQYVEDLYQLYKKSEYYLGEKNDKHARIFINYVAGSTAAVMIDNRIYGTSACEEALSRSKMMLFLLDEKEHQNEIDECLPKFKDLTMMNLYWYSKRYDNIEDNNEKRTKVFNRFDFEGQEFLNEKREIFSEFIIWVTRKSIKDICEPTYQLLELMVAEEEENNISTEHQIEEEKLQKPLSSSSDEEEEFQKFIIPSSDEEEKEKNDTSKKQIRRPQDLDTEDEITKKIHTDTKEKQRYKQDIKGKGEKDGTSPKKGEGVVKER